MKSVRVGDFLTDGQIARCIELYEQHARSELGTSLAKRICDEVTGPNIAEIDRKLGQENDPMYLAYVVEYALVQASDASRRSGLSVGELIKKGHLS